MRNKQRTYSLLGLALLCIACGNDSEYDSSDANQYAYESEVQNGDYIDPYPEFCVKGVQADIDPNKLKDHDCEIRTHGRNRSDMTDPKANAFYADLSNYAALKQAGIKNIGLDIKVGKSHPKIKPGTYTVVPYEILSTEPGQLPDIMVHLSDYDRSSSFEAVMSPDAVKFKNNALVSPENYPSFEIIAASLTVTHVEDIPMDEDEQESHDRQASMGMLTGQQYVKGTLSFTVKKFGPKGANFGPETFTFGSRNDWAYFPEHSK